MISIECLAQLPLFADVSRERLAHVVSSAAEIILEPGEYAVREDEEPSFMVVLEGSVEVTKRIAGVERVIGTRSAGQHLGELPLLLGAPALSSARAITSAHLMRLDEVIFRELVRESATFSSAVARAMSEHVDEVQRLARETPTVVLIGKPWDSSCHELRDFLTRNQVAFDWLEPSEPTLPEHDPEAPQVGDRYPRVRVGERLLVAPSRRELATALGLQVDPSGDSFDLVIVGAGPAGLAAAVYGASEGLRTLMIERDAPGGQAASSARIENYLGFPAGIPGSQLGHRALDQAIRLGAEIVVTRSVTSITPGNERHEVVLDDGRVLRGRAIVLATGVEWRRPKIPGIDRLTGRGVFYGAARAEARTTRGKDVYLIGAGNSAGQAALLLSEYARTVTIICRGESLESVMSIYLIRRLNRRNNIHVELKTEIAGVRGDDHLREIAIRGPRGESRRDADAIFVFTGSEPQTSWLPATIVRDDGGYIRTGRDIRFDPRVKWPLDRDPFLVETSVPRIFAVGDVREGSIKRVAAAVGEGSMAIAFVHQALGESGVGIAQPNTNQPRPPRSHQPSTGAEIR